jgi:hypothetical protein
MVRPFTANFWTCARPSYRWFLYSILRPKNVIDSVFRCETWNNWISDFLKRNAPFSHKGALSIPNSIQLLKLYYRTNRCPQAGSNRCLDLEIFSLPDSRH